MTSSDIFFAEATAARLVSETHRAGRPAVPPGGRDDVLLALTRAVVNPVFAGTYFDAVARERQRLGVRTAEAPDVRDDEILRSGFGCLSDDELAGFAISPGIAGVLADLVNRTGPWSEHDPEDVGPWFTDAVAREYAPEHRTPKKQGTDTALQPPHVLRVYDSAEVDEDGSLGQPYEAIQKSRSGFLKAHNSSDESIFIEEAANDPGPATADRTDFSPAFSEAVALPKAALFNRAIDRLVPSQPGVVRLLRSTEACEAALIVWVEGEFSRLCAQRGLDRDTVFEQVEASLNVGLFEATQLLCSVIRSMGPISSWPLSSLIAVSIAMISTEIDDGLFDSDTEKIPSSRTGRA